VAWWRPTPASPPANIRHVYSHHIVEAISRPSPGPLSGVEIDPRRAARCPSSKGVS